MDKFTIINTLRKEYRPWINSLSPQELRAIKKYTCNSQDRRPNRLFERINATLRDDYNRPDRALMVKYGAIISNAISKHTIREPITVYRGSNIDVRETIPVGMAFSFHQFISTSIRRSCILKKRFMYVISVPSGTKGAYIEEISRYPKQYEFLLDFDLEYRIMDIRSEEEEIYLEVLK